MTDPDLFFLDGNLVCDLPAKNTDRATHQARRGSGRPDEHQPDDQSTLLPELLSAKHTIHLVDGEPFEDNQAQTVSDPLPEELVQLRQELHALRQINLNAVDLLAFAQSLLDEAQFGSR